MDAFEQGAEILEFEQPIADLQAKIEERDWSVVFVIRLNILTKSPAFRNKSKSLDRKHFSAI